MRTRRHALPAFATVCLIVASPAAMASAPAGLECVKHDWAVPPGQWSGSGGTDPTGLLMGPTTRWVFHLADCSLTSGVCDAFGSGSRVFQNGVERPEWDPTDTVPTIVAVGNTVTYTFAMRDAFVPFMGQPRFENMDWSLSAMLPSAPSDSPSAAELGTATDIAVTIDHWVDIGVIVHWIGGADDTHFTSCTPVPTSLSVDDVSLAEGSGGGTTDFLFTVSRSQNTTAVSVTAATADGTAEAGTDYAAFGPTVLVFPAGGSLNQTVTVQVAADDGFESDEGFTLELSAPSNATIADGTGDGTILNDDTVASLSVDDVAQMEGDSGSSDFVFTVSRSHSHDAVGVDVATADGTAAAGSDYTATGPTTLSFPAGGTLQQTVAVAVTGDALVELDESFTLELSNPTLATIADGTGDGTIDNDDAALLSIDSVSGPEGTDAVSGEGGAARFGARQLTLTATLDAAVDTAVSVDFDSRDGTAEDETGDGDYTAVAGTLQFDGDAGETEVVVVDVTPDARPERDEIFFVDLSNVMAGGRDVTLGDAEGEATVLDDDDACPAYDIYRQPFDSPPDLAGHPAEDGGVSTLENVVDGAGVVTTLPPGPVSALRVWGLASDGTDPCTLDPQVPFTLDFHQDAAGFPGALVAERVTTAVATVDAAPGVVQVDFIFPPFEGGAVSWIAVSRPVPDGCAFLWLAEDLQGSYDDQVFIEPALVPDDAYLCVGDLWLFADGFESGDTSAWSQVTQ